MDDAPKIARINIRLTESEKRELEARAKAFDMTTTEYLLYKSLHG